MFRCFRVFGAIRFPGDFREIPTWRGCGNRKPGKLLKSHFAPDCIPAMWCRDFRLLGFCSQFESLAQKSASPAGRTRNPSLQAVFALLYQLWGREPRHKGQPASQGVCGAALANSPLVPPLAPPPTGRPRNRQAAQVFDRTPAQRADDHGLFPSSCSKFSNAAAITRALFCMA